MADKSVKLKKEHILFANKASQLLEEQKVEEATNICEAGVREFPFYAPGHYILGLCYDSIGKMEDAKQEFERVLIYDPSHNTAMRKLSDIYNRKSLENVANDLLLKEALYSPLNAEIIEILKEKKLYNRLNPLKDISAQHDVPVEADQQELEETIEESQEKISEQSADSFENEINPVEQIFAEPQITEANDEPATENSEALIETDQINDSQEDSGFDNLDPLAGLDEKENTAETKDPLQEDISEIVKDEENNVARSEDTGMDTEIADEKVEALAMDDQDMDENEWLEVENLLIDEEYEDLESTELDTYSSVLPQSEMLRNDTELLLEELKSADSDSNVTNETSEIELETKEVDKINDQETSQAEEVEDQQVNAPQETDDQAAENSFEEEGDIESFDEESEVTIRDIMENPNLVTPTFGEILIAQHKFSEARHVFLELQKREPQNQRITKKIYFLNKFLETQNPV